MYSKENQTIGSSVYKAVLSKLITKFFIKLEQYRQRGQAEFGHGSSTNDYFLAVQVLVEKCTTGLLV